MKLQSLNLDLPRFADIRRASADRRAAEDKRHTHALKRSYEAARINRLTRDFTVTNTSTNWELRRSLRYLRARSRDLARNNDYVKKFLSLVRTNVAGPAGMKLQVRARDKQGNLDQDLNRAVERAWGFWGHCEYASASGKLSWTEIQRKYISTMARDGEVLIRMIDAEHTFGFALKFYSVDWLDETFSDILPGGNRVIMSVEIDANDRPVAYWLTPPPSDHQLLDNSARRRTRVPAAEIIHDFLHDDANADGDDQTRGVPWLHTAIMRLKILGAYEEAELIAARVGACKMGFFKEDSPDADEYTGADEDEEGRERAPLMDAASPGQFGLIPAGYTFESYDPTHPNTSYPSFIKGVLRGIATGLDVTYFSLAEDLESVNYSSARIGLLQERDVWRGLQNHMIEHLCRRVYIAWLKSVITTGALRVRPSDYERLIEPVWQPRGWKWVDPQKEITAKIMAIINGLETRTDIIAEQGGDFEETMTQLAHEQKIIEASGVTIGAGKPAKPGLPSAPDESEKDEEE